jgi:hypothetical protein
MSLSGACQTLAAGWLDLWFKREPTTLLELIRMGVGSALLLAYGLTSDHLFELFGDQGWISRVALAAESHSPWTPSLLLYLNTPWHWIAFHACFLSATAAFTVGWHTAWVKWWVLIGHVSYLNRNPAITYGVDDLLASLLFLLCLAPVGRTLCFDHYLAPRGATRSEPAAPPEPVTSAWGFACQRLIQLQMAVFYFFAGVEKLRGESWQHGYALWIALTNDEYATFPLGWLAEHFWIINLMTYYTLLLELAFPFLIWQRPTRPYLLASAVLLQLGIALMLGLHLFSFVVIIGLLAFLRPEWLTTWGAITKPSSQG